MAEQIKETKSTNVKQGTQTASKSQSTKTSTAPNAKDKEITKLKAENSKLEKIISEQKSDFDSKMQDMEMKINLLMATLTQSSKNAKTETAEEAKEVVVGCRAFSGAALSTSDGTICYIFKGGEEKHIDIEDLKTLLRESGVRNNKTLFADGLFYFIDEKMYKEFRIKRTSDLSKENIIKLLLVDDVDEMLRGIKDFTNNKSKMAVTHTMQFMIAQMLIDESNPLAFWKYENRKALETYLENRFDDLIAQSGIFNIIRK